MRQADFHPVDGDELEVAEVMRRIHVYRELEATRMAPPYVEAFSGEGHRLDFKGQLTPNKGKDPGEWFTSVVDDADTERKRGEEYARNLRQVEMEEERREKAALLKRLSSHKKNVSRIRPSRVRDSEEFEEVMSPTNAPKLSPFSVPCFVRVRCLDGGLDKVEFQTEDKLRRILEYAVQKYSLDDRYMQGLALKRPFPPPGKRFTPSELENLTLDAAEVANGSVNIIQDNSPAGWVLKEDPAYDYAVKSILKSHRIKGEDRSVKEAFKRRQAEKRAAQRRREKLAAKKLLEKTRQRIAEDKARRAAEARGETYEPKRKRSSASAAASSPEHAKSTMINLRLPDGRKFTQSFKASDALSEIAEYLYRNAGLIRAEPFAFVVAFPKRREFRQSQFSRTKVRDLKLGKRGVVAVKQIT